MITTSEEAKKATIRKLVCELVFSEFVIEELEEHREKGIKASKEISAELHDRMPDTTLIDEYIAVRDKHEAAGTLGTEEFREKVCVLGRAIAQREGVSVMDIFLYGQKECEQL